jgi:hypothetical protein
MRTLSSRSVYGCRGRRLLPGTPTRVSILGIVSLCFGGSFVGVGYSAARHGKPNGRLYAAVGVVLLITGILLNVF